MIDNVYALISGCRVQVSEDTDNITSLPSSYVVLELEGVELPESVTLDNRSSPLALDSGCTRGHIVVDLFRSVGFHKLEAQGKTYVFATDDAKLRLAGIETILRYIETEGLGWNGQLFFTDGTVLRHPKVDYAWLMSSGPVIAGVARNIARSPFLKSALKAATTRGSAGTLHIQKTIQLLRQNPHLLEQIPDGPITVGSQHYVATKAVQGVRTQSCDTVGNRRAALLLISALALAGYLERTDIPKQQLRQVRLVQQDLSSAAELFPFRQLAPVAHRVSRSASVEETVDPRYGQLFNIYEELASGLGWRPGTRVAPRFAYVLYSDQIYQAFVAVALARAFQLAQKHSCLEPNLDIPLFESDEFALYYDTIPPRQWFRNWRDSSERPADMRPDLTLVDKRTRCGILLDAKYRVEAAGVPPTSAINECQLYMHSFGQPTIAICYPGPELTATEVKGGGYRILQLPVSPVTGLDAFLSNDLRPLITGAMRPLAG